MAVARNLQPDQRRQRRRRRPGVQPAAADATAASSDRFLKLLVAQMQNQDPLNPMDNAAGHEPDGADQHRHRHRQAQHARSPA